MLAMITVLLHALPSPPTSSLAGGENIAASSVRGLMASHSRGESHSGLRGQRLQGRCSRFDATKRYGFITSETLDRDVFVHSSKILPNNPTILSTEDEVSFFLAYDDAKDRLYAEKVELVGDRTMFKCFSMSQPFASLLMKNHKTIESRNSNLFIQSKGLFALHVGRKPWKDSKYRDVLMSQGLTASQISDLCSLPDNFAPGDIVGIVELGETWLGTYEERGQPKIESAVVAAREDMGKFLTPILRTYWLKRPLTVPGKPGIWEVSIPNQLLPDEIE